MAGWGLGWMIYMIIEFLINNKPMKLPLGAFKISTQQIMREDPLQNILTTGIRVEKAKP